MRSILVGWTSSPWLRNLVSPTPQEVVEYFFICQSLTLPHFPQGGEQGAIAN
ncbi:hypothetical protein [Nostoc sp.]|uniref:hypothetical protein n=1 Tax=Nostoc sp. TaxID=1180 RepID=UPI002FF88611